MRGNSGDCFNSPKLNQTSNSLLCSLSIHRPSSRRWQYTTKLWKHTSTLVWSDQLAWRCRRFLAQVEANDSHHPLSLALNQRHPTILLMQIAPKIQGFSEQHFNILFDSVDFQETLRGKFLCNLKIVRHGKITSNWYTQPSFFGCIRGR